jgi:hypothetical protein
LSDVKESVEPLLANSQIVAASYYPT